MEAVIAREAPTARVVHVSHLIGRHDVWAGAMTLWRAAPWLVPGVILAVVDPGVGTERGAVALEVAGAGAVLIGPDNGLLLPAAARLGPITAAVELPTDPSVPGATFAGRDVFAPAAARAANGVALEALGTPVDPTTLIGRPVPEPVVEEDGRLRSEILWVDHFGNAQLNVDVPRLQGVLGVASAAAVVAAIGERRLHLRIVASYGAIADGEVALVVDSYGLLALSCNRSSAAGRLAVGPGEPVWLCAEPGPVTVP